VQRTLRYFVRSYMTKPTTISAITDIPAKIPRPIGSTEIFFPGIWKAAAALEDGVAEVLSAAGDKPLSAEGVAVGTALAGGGVGDGVLVAAGREIETEENP
jgi:hypothetical protein